MLGAVFGGVRGGAAGEVVEEVEVGDGGALGVSVAHEEALAAEDGGAARAREAQHGQPAAAQRGRCGPPRLVCPLTALSPLLYKRAAPSGRDNCVSSVASPLTRLAHSAQHAPIARYIHPLLRNLPLITFHYIYSNRDFDLNSTLLRNMIIVFSLLFFIKTKQQTYVCSKIYL